MAENNKPSEADILAQNAQFKTDLEAVRAELKTATTSLSTITAEREQLKVDKALLTGQLATANTNLSTVTAERDALKAEKKTFEAAVASKIATLGITDNAAKKPDVGADGKKLTWTEKILAERGCKSLDELVAKRQPAVA